MPAVGRWDLTRRLKGQYTSYFFVFPVALRHNAGHGLLILEVFRSHTTTHQSR